MCGGQTFCRPPEITIRYSRCVRDSCFSFVSASLAVGEGEIFRPLRIFYKASFSEKMSPRPENAIF